MNILDKRFQYTPSHATDIRKTFAKARAEQAAQKELAAKMATHGTPEFYRLWRAK